MKLFSTLALIIGTLLPSHVLAWGFNAHKEINRQAVFALPPELFPFYKLNIEFITQKAINPDQRRYILENEASKHFIDIDYYTDTAFIKSAPTWYNAVEKYTEDSLNKHGILPWNILALKKQLTDAFVERNLIKIVKLSADVGHYIGDAHVPLHTTKNYNGQFTNQVGIHSLWETRIYLLHEPNYNYWGIYGTYLPKWHDIIWNTVFKSNALVDSVLNLELLTSKEFSEDKKYQIETNNGVNYKTYSTAFCNAYHDKMNGMVENRMRSAIELIASFWYSCWVDAGKPILPSPSLVDTEVLIAEDTEMINKINPKTNLDVHDCDGKH